MYKYSLVNYFYVAPSYKSFLYLKGSLITNAKLNVGSVVE